MLISVEGHPNPGFVWSAEAYAQGDATKTSFSSVNDARTLETPVLDQNAVPTTTMGASWRGEWRDADGSTTNAGADFRSVKGETRNDLDSVDGRYAVGLDGGGEQGDLGIYVLRDQPVLAAVRIALGARIDGWEEIGGHSVETDLLADHALSDREFATDAGVEASPSASFVWVPSNPWRVHGNVQQAFTRPTLSELFQPYGHDALLIAPNPALRTARNLSVEVGGDYVLHVPAWPGSNSTSIERFPAAHTGTITFGGALFSNYQRDVIGTASVPRDSGGLPIFGAAPNGYLEEQWMNLERSRILGATFTAEWRPSPWLTFEAKEVLTDPRIAAAAFQPDLVGRQLAGVPRRSGLLSAAWNASSRLTLSAAVRAYGREFQDEENTLRISAATVVNIHASYQMTKMFEAFVTVENVTDARIETDRSADGIIYTGSPTLFHEGVRVTW